MIHTESAGFTLSTIWRYFNSRIAHVTLERAELTPASAAGGLQSLCLLLLGLSCLPGEVESSCLAEMAPHGHLQSQFPCRRSIRQPGWLWRSLQAHCHAVMQEAEVTVIQHVRGETLPSTQFSDLRLAPSTANKSHFIIALVKIHYPSLGLWLKGSVLV